MRLRRDFLLIKWCQCQLCPSLRSGHNWKRFRHHLISKTPPHSPNVTTQLSAMCIKCIGNFISPATTLLILFRIRICKRTSRSFKVSNWDILEFRSQFEIRTFISLNTLDYGTLINKEMESKSNNFYVLCWNSPRCCPRSSPDSWIRFIFFKTCR